MNQNVYDWIYGELRDEKNDSHEGAREFVISVAMVDGHSESEAAEIADQADKNYYANVKATLFDK